MQRNGPQVGRSLQKTKVHDASSRDAPGRLLIDEPRLDLLGSSRMRWVGLVPPSRTPSNVHSAHALAGYG